MKLTPLMISLLLPLPAMAASIADEPVTEADYAAEALRCIYRTRIKRIHFLDTRHVLFQVGETWMLNVTNTRCPLRGPNSSAKLDPGRQFKERLCSRDRLFVTDQLGAAGTTATGTAGRVDSAVVSAGSCVLGRFEPVTEEQVVAVTRAITAEQRQRTLPQLPERASEAPADAVEAAPRLSPP